MQKEQNVVINWLIILIMMSYSYSGFSQKKLEGIYKRVLLPYGTQFYTFSQKGTFKYQSGSDMAEIELYGEGNYTMSKNWLVLNYNKLKPLPYSYYKKEIWKNYNDSITVLIHVYNMKGKPISNTSLYIKSNDEKPFVRKTNKEGFLTVKFLHKTNSPISIRTLDINFIGCRLTLSRDYNCHLTFYLEKSSWTPILNQIDSLKIKEFTPNYLKLETKKGRILTWEKHKP